MSLVEDVEAQIQQLKTQLRAKQLEIQTLGQSRFYHTEAGVDVDSEGRSLASVEVTIAGGRNLHFKSGLFAAGAMYLRMLLEPRGSCMVGDSDQCTRKQPASACPSWQERLVFSAVRHSQVFLHVGVLQEEWIGRDTVIGSVRLALADLRDERLQEEWRTIANDNQEPVGEVLLGLRCSRSRLQAVKCEAELLQNQIRELQSYADIHPTIYETSEQYVPMQQLKGKDVTSDYDLPVSTTTSDVAIQQRKRYHLHSMDRFAGQPEVSGKPRWKRQKVDENHSSVSFADRVAEWLLPFRQPKAEIEFPLSSTATTERSTPRSKRRTGHRKSKHK